MKKVKKERESRAKNAEEKETSKRLQMYKFLTLNLQHNFHFFSTIF